MNRWKKIIISIIVLFGVVALIALFRLPFWFIPAAIGIWTVIFISQVLGR